MTTRFLAVILTIATLQVKAQAATLTVTNTADSGAGTLRAALAGAADGDTISFSVAMPATITLTSGELMVNKNVAIVGPGPANLVLNGNSTSRVFHVAPGTVVTVSGLTVTNGLASGTWPASIGGGIINDQATLTVSNLVICGSSADQGGGIINAGLGSSATLNILDSIVSDNYASGGGGVNNDGRSATAAVVLTIVNSTIRGNSANSGGGIHNDGGGFANAILVVSNTTVSGNSADGYGGGIFNQGEWQNGFAALTIVNSTISGNWGISGGGIDNDGSHGGTAVVQVANCTITGNSATNGGGICIEGRISGKATMIIANSILNAGTLGVNILNASGTVTSAGYNLTSDSGVLNFAGGTGDFTATGDQRNTDPKLGPLQDNGGATYTHALLPGSPAIDKGKRNAIPTLAVGADQRGQPRPIDVSSIANALGGDGSDIGAVEEQCVFTLDPTNATFNAAGGLGSVAVDASATDCFWTATSNDGFITITSGSSGQGTGTVSYSVAASGSATRRIGTIAIDGLTTSVTQDGNTPHDLTVVKLKAPKKVTLSATTKPSKFSVSIQNLGPQTETIPDLATLQGLVSVDVETLGTNCPSFAATLVTPKVLFPINLAPHKKLTLSYTATFGCANDPLATTKTAAHNDYKVVATINLGALGETDTTASNNTCPRPPSGSDPGCGNKTTSGSLGADVLTDVVVK